MTPDFFDRIFGSSDSPDSLAGVGEETLGNDHLGLVAGLGNPGQKYDLTRHNIGFLVLDRFAEEEGLVFGNERKWEAEAVRSAGVVYLKPKTYMNDSGRAVGKAAKFHQVDPARCLIVTDEVSLPLGSIRIRQKGSAGGHNGLRSISAVLGTDTYPRLRMGVGRGEGGEAGRSGNLASHVLGRFSDDERSELEQAIATAIEAIRMILAEGFDAAMSRYNRKGQGAPGRGNANKDS